MKTLVLISGYAFKTNIWNNMMQELSGKYKIIQLDIADHHPSILYDFLESKIPHNANICGWSLGGLIAAKFCSLFPEKNFRLVTIASSPNFRNVIDIDLFQKLKCLLDENIEKFLAKFLYISLYPYSSISNIKYFRGCLVHNYAFLKAYLDYLISTNISEAYKNLKAKSLHILGGKDSIVSRGAFEQWHANSKATIWEYSEWGHNPFLHTKKLSNIVDRWITQNS